MKTTYQRLLIVFGIALLNACATQTPHLDACVGTVLTPPTGLIEASDEALLAQAIGAPEKGALCKGKVFVAEKAVTVYRVWDAAKSYTMYGRWWSLSIPTGPRDRYQLENDICPEWSVLNKMSSCTIKVGTKIVIGPGQSAKCTDNLLPASAINQVYIANDSRDNALFVEHCSDGADWPEAAK